MKANPRYTGLPALGEFVEHRPVTDSLAMRGSWAGKETLPLGHSALHQLGNLTCLWVLVSLMHPRTVGMTPCFFSHCYHR